MIEHTLGKWGILEESYKCSVGAWLGFRGAVHDCTCNDTKLMCVYTKLMCVYTSLFVQKHYYTYTYVYCTCRYKFLLMISILPSDVVASDMEAHDMRCI